VVKAAAGINQCRKLQQPSLPLINNILIGGKPFSVAATLPVNNESLCFLTTGGIQTDG